VSRAGCLIIWSQLHDENTSHEISGKLIWLQTKKIPVNTWTTVPILFPWLSNGYSLTNVYNNQMCMFPIVSGHVSTQATHYHMSLWYHGSISTKYFSFYRKVWQTTKFLVLIYMVHSFMVKQYQHQHVHLILLPSTIVKQAYCNCSCN